MGRIKLLITAGYYRRMFLFFAYLLSFLFEGKCFTVYLDRLLRRPYILTCHDFSSIWAYILRLFGKSQVL